MQRSELSDVSVFVEVARCNGFRAAADKLKIGPGTVSEAIQRFEDRLGVRLFERTTRSIALTTAGEQLYRRSLPALAELENAFQDLNDETRSVSGTLRLSAPRSAGPFFLDSLVAKFATEHPGVAVELIYDDQKVDLVTSGVDAAIRSTTLLEQDTHAIAIGPELRMTIVASPDYLEQRGVPKAPEDLVDHDGICFAFGQADRLAPWRFEVGGKVCTVVPKPRMVCNDLLSLLRYATAGAGVAYVYAKTAEPLIATNRLVELFKGKVPALPQYTLNYLTKRHMPKRLRAFIDLARKN